MSVSVILITIMSIIFAAALLVINFFIAKEFYKAAVMKGWASKRYFWIPFLLTFVGYILVAALPDRGGQDMSVFCSDDLPDI